MAIARRFKISHDEVFPFGAYLVGEVGPVFDFEKSTKDSKIQQLDKDSGLPLWSVEVLDADPEAAKKSKTVTVKLAGKVQPVPPEALPGLPFRPGGVPGTVGGRPLGAGSALVCVLLGLVVGTTPVGPAINQGLKSVGDWAWAKVSTCEGLRQTLTTKATRCP